MKNGDGAADLKPIAHLLLQPIGRTCHRVLMAVSVVVFDHLAGPLLEIGRRNDGQVSV